MAAPLASAAEGALECLPHELRQLALPIVRHLFSTGHASLPPGAGVESLRAVVQTVGAAASLVLSRALLDESGRMQLWLGLKALAESSPGLAASPTKCGSGLAAPRSTPRAGAWFAAPCVSPRVPPVCLFVCPVCTAVAG